MSWEYFILFAIAALVCWALGAFAAWKGTKTGWVYGFERKGLRLAGMKMVQLTDEVLSEHYAHLSSKPFFQRVKDAMMVCPVIVCCFEGVDAVQVVRTLTGPTNGRLAAPGTIRGDYSMSFQENIVHASDSPETAEVELKRFFKPEEIFEYKQAVFGSLYANDEY